MHLNSSMGIRLVGCGMPVNVLTGLHLKITHTKLVIASTTVTYSIMSHTQILSLHVETVTINLSELGILTNKSNLTGCCGSTKLS